MAEFPAPAEGMLLTYLVVSGDVARSRRFYTEVLGGQSVLDTDGFAIVALANGWVTITSPGAPTPDKPVRTDKPYQTSRPTRSASEAGGTIGGPHRRRAGSILLFASALSAGERRVSRPNPPRD